MAVIDLKVYIADNVSFLRHREVCVQARWLGL